MRRVRAVILFCVLLFSLSLAAFAKEPVYPAYSGFVNDFAGVLDASSAQKLEDLCRTLEKKTSAELAIAAVKSVAPLDSKTYAVKLFEKWKIGKKGKDNGILVLLAMEERRVEIEVGYGLEGVITDARAGEILDRYVVPYFKEGKFGEGLYNGAAAIAERIAQTSGQEMGEEYRAKKSAGESGENWFTLISIIAIIVVVLLSILGAGIAAGLFGAVFGALFGYAFLGIIGAMVGAVVGFMLSYAKFPTSRFGGGGWGGGFGGGWSGGGGGGGFGGGSSGGGGAGRGW